MQAYYGPAEWKTKRKKRKQKKCQAREQIARCQFVWTSCIIDLWSAFHLVFSTRAQPQENNNSNNNNQHTNTALTRTLRDFMGISSTVNWSYGVCLCVNFYTPPSMVYICSNARQIEDQKQNADTTIWMFRLPFTTNAKLIIVFCFLLQPLIRSFAAR